MRLAKYLAGAGIASRRGAEELVRAGDVRVNGAVVADPARDVGEADEVLYGGVVITPVLERVVYALNKPLGVVSTARDPQRRPTVVSLVPSELRLYPIGRLDLDTTGLILLTNDGELAHRLMHPRFAVPKTYRAVLGRPPVRERALRALREGVELDDGRTAPAHVRRLRGEQLELTIHEGRKRQIRRMCEHVGHPVKALERVQFGPLALGGLDVGAYRRLGAAEVAALSEAAVAPAARPSAAASPSAPRRRPAGSA